MHITAAVWYARKYADTPDAREAVGVLADYISVGNSSIDRSLAGNALLALGVVEESLVRYMTCLLVHCMQPGLLDGLLEMSEVPTYTNSIQRTMQAIQALDKLREELCAVTKTNRVITAPRALVCLDSAVLQAERKMSGNEDSTE